MEELAEDSPEAIEMVRCLREETVDLDGIKELLKEKRAAVNVREGTFGFCRVFAPCGLFPVCRKSMQNQILHAIGNFSNKSY